MLGRTGLDILLCVFHEPLRGCFSPGNDLPTLVDESPPTVNMFSVLLRLGRVLEWVELRGGATAT